MLVQLMGQWWNECVATGNPGYVMQKKLDFLRGKLRIWAKDNFGRVEARIKWWESTLDFERLEETSKLTKEDQLARREAEFKLNEATKDETKLWSKSAKRVWNKKGGKYTAFSHRLVNARQNKAISQDWL